jgi:hypothetical protein
MLLVFSVGDPGHAKTISGFIEALDTFSEFNEVHVDFLSQLVPS